MSTRIDSKTIAMLSDLSPDQVRDAAIAAGMDPLTPPEALREMLHTAYVAGALAGSVITHAWENPR